jgi:hypothetical protein
MRLFKTFYIFTQGSLKNSKNYYPKGLTMVGIVKLFLEKKILVKVIAIDSVHPILYDQLRSFGCTVDECSHLKGEELLKILPQYEGFIIRSKFKITKEIIAGRVGTGVSALPPHRTVREILISYGSYCTIKST